MNTVPELHFLGWDGSALQGAADFLVERYRTGGIVDLRGALVVVTGRRAGRRLLEILVERAACHSILLRPPDIETVGSLPERLYLRKRPFASELAQRLAWADTLRRSPAERLEKVFRRLPERDEPLEWLELASLLRRQHVELAAEGLDFRAVIQTGTRVDGFDELPRWQALSEIQQAYLRYLDSLDLWDVQTARLVAVEKQECATARDLILVGAVDLSRVLRQMLQQVADRVTAVVFAPVELRKRFDEFGCLAVDHWQDEQLPLSDEQIEVVGGSAEQAAAVIRRLECFDSRYCEDEVTLGILDGDLVPDVRHQLERRGLVGHWSAGRPIRELGPYRLLEGLSRYLNGRRWADFAALVRHEDVSARLAQAGLAEQWIAELDYYYAEHLPCRLDGKWWSNAAGYVQLQQAYRTVEVLVAPLSEGRRNLNEWSRVVMDVLLDLCGDRAFDRLRPGDQMALAAWQRIGEALREQSEIPESLPSSVTVQEAIQVTLGQVADDRVPEAAEPSRVDMLGWLELPMDDAPALIIAGFNEPFVPSSLNSDLFLPNALRRELGLVDNDRRYARDVYALRMLLESHDTVHIIGGRRSRDGTPMAPSRLLFATSSETAAKRALQFFRPPRAPSAAHSNPGNSPTVDESQLLISPPQPLRERMTRLPITGFRAYLACPYRFYLTYVQRLTVLRDDAEELDGAAFGVLAHEVLKRFGRGRSRHSTDAEAIRRTLHRHLNRCVVELYGRTALPAVYVQVEQLRLRLEAFAVRQAEWASQGWRIERIEVPTELGGGAPFRVDDDSIRLSGRIDRMDRNTVTGQWAILDYKTSDAAATPEKNHRQSGAWIDLQLPLYRHLAAGLLAGAGSAPGTSETANIAIAGLPGNARVDVTERFSAENCRLGYISLPKDISAVGFQFADWTDAELQEADETARGVVRRIWREEFWPPADPPPPFTDHLAPICQMAGPSTTRTPTGSSCG